VSGGRVNAKKVLNALSGVITPMAPSNLSAYPKAWTVIQLAWNDNSSNELGFEIQRRDNYQANFIHDNCSDMNSTSTVLFRDETINNPNPNQRTFEYRVRATNRAGASAFSNIVSASVPYTVPEAPTDLLGNSPAVYPLVNIFWSNHAVNALNNFVERRIPGSADWEVIAALGYDADSYSDPSALPGYTYEYRIRAWNPLGYSDYSNTIAIEVIVW
jgi:titin